MLPEIMDILARQTGDIELREVAPGSEPPFFRWQSVNSSRRLKRIQKRLGY